MSGATLLPDGKQQFFDNDGNPLSSGTVGFYIPTTMTPKNTWQDEGETILNTNPVSLDGAGRAIIYGSGTYRQIVKDSNGNVIWDQLTASTNSSQVFVGGQTTGTGNAQILALTGYTLEPGNLVLFVAGLSNTGAATLNIEGTGVVPITKLSGSSQVPLTGGELQAGQFTAVFYDGIEYQLVGAIPVGGSSQFGTGDTKWRPFSGSISGWVRLNGLTIGNASSSATELASAGTSALFSLLWNSFNNTQCPVLPGGRGVDAATDYAANKTIGLLDMRGMSQIGLDDMGNVAASRFTGVPFASGNATTPGSVAGENTHVLLVTELATHNHTLTDPTHVHAITADVNQGNSYPGTGGSAGNEVTRNSAPASTGITLAPAGSNTAHNTVQNSMLGTWYMKL